MKDCNTCDYKKWKDTDNWCYHHKKEPRQCTKYRPIPVAKMAHETK